jgi:hypothetical protein
MRKNESKGKRKGMYKGWRKEINQERRFSMK